CSGFGYGYASNLQTKGEPSLTRPKCLSLGEGGRGSPARLSTAAAGVALPLLCVGRAGRFPSDGKPDQGTSVLPAEGGDDVTGDPRSLSRLYFLIFAARLFLRPCDTGESGSLTSASNSRCTFSGFFSRLLSAPEVALVS